MNPFGIQKLDPLVHILPIRAERQILIEMADIPAHFFLSIGHHCGQQVCGVDHLEGFAVHQDGRLTAGRILFHPHGPLPKCRINIARVEIKRLHKVAVTIDYVH